MGSKIYDDVFRTLVNDCSSLLIPYVNEMFHENYTGKEKIQFYPNEHFINWQKGNEKEKITDTCFGILSDKLKKYHLECQSTKDNSMLLRMFEYDTQIALDNGSIEENVLTVTFPNSGILYLRGKRKVPDTLQVCMETPGGSVTYDVKVMKLQMYRLEEIFEKQLYILIPFYIFNHEVHFSKYNNNEAKLSELIDELNGIRLKLEELCCEEVINEFTKRTILDMSEKVIGYISKKYRNVRKGVEKIMCGEVLEHQAKTILNRGIAQGREEIIRENYLKQIVIIQKKLKKEKSIQQIADELEEQEENIIRIVDIMQECGMENTEEIVNKLMK